MAGLRLSQAAKKDLLDIGRYTLEVWGEEQAVRYLGQLDACFHRMAKTPKCGRPCEGIKAGYRRLLEGRHVIFFRVVRKQVQIIRILHERMLPTHHF